MILIRVSQVIVCNADWATIRAHKMHHTNSTLKHIQQTQPSELRNVIEAKQNKWKRWRVVWGGGAYWYVIQYQESKEGNVENLRCSKRFDWIYDQISATIIATENQISSEQNWMTREKSLQEIGDFDRTGMVYNIEKAKRLRHKAWDDSNELGDIFSDTSTNAWPQR